VLVVFEDDEDDEETGLVDEVEVGLVDEDEVGLDEVTPPCELLVGGGDEPPEHSKTGGPGMVYVV